MLEIIFIVVFAIFFTFLTYKNLTLAICLIIVALPTYLIKFSIGPIPFTVLEIMILILFIIWLIRTIKNKLFNNIELSAYKWPIIIFLIGSIVGLIVSPDLRAAAGLWKAYLIEPLLFFIVFINTIRTKQQRGAILGSMGVLAFYISVIAIIQFLTGWQIPDPWQEIGNRRATSVFPYPNAVGLMLAPLAAIFLGILMQKFIKRKYLYLAIFGLLVLIILGILAAGTEGALIAIVVSFIFFVFFLKSRWVIIALLFIAFGALLIIPTTQTYLENLLLFKEVSGDVHLALWQGTADLLKNQPLIGSGLAGFSEVYQEYKMAKHTELLLYPHNIFLNWWTQLGIFGLISLVWLIALYFRDSIQIIRKKIKQKKLAIILLGTFIAILVYGLVDVPYFKNDLAVLFWLLFGLIYSLKHNPQEES